MSRIGSKPPKTNVGKTPAAKPKKPASKPSTGNKTPTTGGWKPKPGSKPTNRPLE